MAWLEICPEVKETLQQYIADQKMGITIRLETLGIGCMGAVIGFASDTKKDSDLTMELDGLSFIANRNDAEKFGGYLIIKSKSGIRIKTKLKVTGGCETCYNTRFGEGCH